MIKESESVVWGLANKNLAIIEQWLKQNDGKDIRLSLKPVDQIKLLRLRTWAMKYGIEVVDILDILMPILRGLIIKRKRKSYGLGITVAALTGDSAERILHRELEKNDPDGKLIQYYKEKKRDEQLELEQDDETPVKEKSMMVDPSAFISRYIQRVEKQRSEQSIYRSERYKPYRWNPWL